MKYGLKDKTIERIHSVFAQHPEVEEAMLYGSRAKGNFKPGSDIDLALKGDGLNLSVINAIGTRIDDLLLPYTFDISIFHKISNPDLIEHINRVGIVFYKKQTRKFNERNVSEKQNFSGMIGLAPPS